MKKKIFALSTVALFAIGLAFYANNSSSVNVLSEDNIEALTDGEGSGSVTIERGSVPYRVWVDNETHIMTVENYRKITNSDGEKECFRTEGYLCQVSTATPIYNATVIIDKVSDLLNNGLFSWLKGLFGKK